MKKTDKKSSVNKDINSKPALTADARERQVITHYLKLGTTKEKIEQEILEKQKELITAKTENLKSAKKIEEIYQKAIDAMKRYGGCNDDDTDV